MAKFQIVEAFKSKKEGKIYGNVKVVLLESVPIRSDRRYKDKDGKDQRSTEFEGICMAGATMRLAIGFSEKHEPYCFGNVEPQAFDLRKEIAIAAVASIESKDAAQA